MTSKISVQQVNDFMEKAFEGRKNQTRPEITVMEDGRAVIRLDVNKNHIRPGGFVSGPTQMALADHAAYVAVFTKIGIVPMAVTSNLNINFLRPCKGDWVEADARIIKIGRTLAVMEVNIKGASSDKVSSQSTVTYSIPMG
ncbi:MAG: PaaI family thioesterase [Acidimicrobiales bacterium]|nr:PaaI family thioesterase [Hyphomonadaceae bacterium]RZV34813.1 MAG: PaaI family thioesterase [Acidimicrobiales bacterium]